MWLELLESSLDKNFGDKLKETLSKLGKTVKEFSKISDVPKSTLYKITGSERKNYSISTLRKIIKTVKRLEGYDEENIIGIITSRGALDVISKEIETDGKKVKIKEYPATTIEEEIIQGIKAEREGVKGIICGPIAATTLEKIVRVPISSLKFEEGPLMNSVERLAKKI